MHYQERGISELNIKDMIGSFSKKSAARNMKSFDGYERMSFLKDNGYLIKTTADECSDYEKRLAIRLDTITSVRLDGHRLAIYQGNHCFQIKAQTADGAKRIFEFVITGTEEPEQKDAYDVEQGTRTTTAE